MSVAATIPPMTVVPMTRLATAPDPDANQSGTQPRINANDVMMIGRKRRRAPSSAASSSGVPRSRASFANSTIRIAFLDQHDEADLGIDVVFHAARPERRELAGLPDTR
jgi:hypothetical protein